jgi:hypothetical protein
MDKVIFKRCAVAFLDILGFKEFMRNVEIPDSKEYGDFCQLQRVVSNQLACTTDDDREQHLFPKDVGLEIIYISDSFILSAPISSGDQAGYNGLVAVSIKAIQLAHQLLKMGFLLRGGVAVGTVYRTDSNIFGTGYQKAYETECQCARTPRILLHESAEEVLKHCFHFGCPIRILSIVMKDGSDSILDTLNSHWGYIGQDRDCDVPQIYDGYRTKIEENLSKLEVGGRREKWEWMAELFNAKQKDASDLHGVTRISEDKFSNVVFGQANNPEQTTFREAFGPFIGRSKHVTIGVPNSPETK